MTESLRHYLELESQLLLYRTSHQEDSSEEDMLLDRMDGIWWSLTIEEREWLNKRNSSAI
jgi:hypothetical protein